MTEKAFRGIFFEDGVRTYMFYGGTDNHDKGVFLASHDPGIVRYIKPSSAFGNPVRVDESLLRTQEGNARIHALIKLVLRDPKRPGVVHTFGNPMRYIGKSGLRGYSVAEFIPGFRRYQAILINPQKGGYLGQNFG